MKQDFSSMREEYDRVKLSEEDMMSHPFSMWEKWMNEVIQDPSVKEPNLMTLATADKDGHPSCRQVLLKGIHEDSFVWYTHYESRKGQQLAENPVAALLFYWESLQRQVRVEGKVEKVSREMSVGYFDKRPLGSRVAAIISSQSMPISYTEMKDNYERLLREANAGKQLLCPEQWGGYILRPQYYEFWQGGENRLHDRFVYTLKNGWNITRVAP